MTKQRQAQPVTGWMASSQDTLVPYPLPSSSIQAVPRKHRRRRPLPPDAPSTMATALSPRSMPNNVYSRDSGPSVRSPRSMPARLSPITMATASQQLRDLTHKEYQDRRHPRHIIFFRNGDAFFKGKKMLITPHRYTSFEDLLSELTRNMKLPYGVRQIFHPSGSKVSDIEELKDGESYVCASFERLKKMKYGSSGGVPHWNGSTRRKAKNDEAYLYAHVPVSFSYPSGGKYAETYKSTFGSGHSGPGAFAYNRTHPGASNESKAFGVLHSDHSPIKPKVVKIVKTGSKPRKVISLLINKRSVQSYEQLIQDMSDAFGLPKYKNNRVRKLYTLRGKEIKSLADFYRDKEGVFVASPSRTTIAEETFVDIYEELFPESPHEQYFHKKRGKKKDSSRHDSGISDDEEKVQKNRRTRSKPTDGDSRVDDSRGTNESDAALRLGSDIEDMTENRHEEEQPERNKKGGRSSDEMQEKLKKKESELLKKEEELRVKEEELRKKEVNEKDRKDKERQEELAQKEAELKAKEEELKKKEVENQEAARREEVERERREKEEKELREREEAEQKAAQEEEEERVAAERRAREEEEKRIEEEQLAQEKGVAELSEKEDTQERVSSGKESLDIPEEAIEYRESTEGRDVDDEERSEKLEADVHHEAERLTSKEDTGITSPSSGTDEILYKESESEDVSPSPHEQNVEFVRQPRTLVKKSEILVQYEIGAKIGDGNFADVHEANRRGTEDLYAMKIIEKAKLKNKEHMVENEIAIMKHVRHSNIVRLYEEFETRGHIYLVMEYVSGGDLFDAISESVKFTEADAARMVRDLASALQYLHNLNVVHRDLKPENLLVNTTESGEIMLKLADFGLAMEVKEPIFTVCGTPTYVAPEILTETGYGLEVDMWAIGVITYILLCGFPPFRSPDRDQEELFELIQAGHFTYVSPYWDNISSAAKDLINHLLVVDREERYTARRVLQHPWVAGGGSVGTLPNLQREVSMNLEKNFAGRRSARRSAKRKAGAPQK